MSPQLLRGIRGHGRHLPRTDELDRIRPAMAYRNSTSTVRHVHSERHQIRCLLRSWPMSSRYTARVSQFSSTRAIVPFRLLVIALLSLCVAAATLGGSSPVAAQDDILSHFKYGSSAPRNGRRAVLDLAGPADRLRGQAAEAARERLRAARLHQRGAAARPADRHDRAKGGPRRPELRHLSRRHRARRRRRRRAEIVLGMPANQMDLQAYARFLTAAADDRGSTAAR